MGSISNTQPQQNMAPYSELETLDLTTLAMQKNHLREQLAENQLNSVSTRNQTPVLIASELIANVFQNDFGAYLAKNDGGRSPGVLLYRENAGPKPLS